MEYLIIALFVISYFGIGIGIAKLFFKFWTDYSYDPSDPDDLLFAFSITVTWPIFALLGSGTWLFGNIFKRIL